MSHCCKSKKEKEQVEEENEFYHICDDCSIIDESVKCQIRGERSTTNEVNIDIYLCDNCAKKRHSDAQKVLQDLELLRDSYNLLK